MCADSAKNIYASNQLLLNGEVESNGLEAVALSLSLLSDWQVAEKPILGPEELLDFCPQCTRLQAVGRVTRRQAGKQQESYCCCKCGFRFTKEYVIGEVDKIAINSEIPGCGSWSIF